MQDETLFSYSLILMKTNILGHINYIMQKYKRLRKQNNYILNLKVRIPIKRTYAY